MTEFKAGMICRHHSGNVYTVLAIANLIAADKKFPVTVVYQGANGNIWCRDREQFKEKFTILFDGTNKA